MTRALRVGVIGLGVGEQHVEAFAAAGADVALVCDLSETKLAAARSRRPALRTTTNAEDVIGDDTLDVVSIASFDQDHAAQVVAALEAGKHVFCEKPLCRTEDELHAIARVSSARPELRLASNLVLRAAPLYAWLRDEARRGGLGRLYAIDGDYLYGRLHKLVDGWRGEVPDYSVMLGGGIHLVDLMLWIADERPVRVSASGTGIATAESAFRGLDFVAATFEFASGLVGRVTANFGCVHPHQHVLRVFGTQATVIHDDRGGRLYRGRDAPLAALDLPSLPPSKGALIPAFVEAVRRGPAEDPGHELDVVSACIAATRAAREGGVVDVDYA